MIPNKLGLTFCVCLIWTATSSAYAAPGDAGRAAGCPMSLPVGNMQQSMSEPIMHYGSAAAAMTALKTSADDLQHQYDEICLGRNGLNSVEECNSMQRLINDSRRLVDGMACHVRAEASAATGDSKLAKNPTNGGARSTAPNSSAGGKPAGADGFLGFGDTGDGSGGKGAGDFLGFEGGDSGTNAAAANAGARGRGQSQVVGNDSFPTSQCQFFSDVSEQHDANALVCVGKQVYECVSRSAKRPADAWSRIPGGGSCGKVRTIETVEQERRQLKDLARQKWLND